MGRSRCDILSSNALDLDLIIYFVVINILFILTKFGYIRSSRKRLIARWLAWQLATGEDQAQILARESISYFLTKYEI